MNTQEIINELTKYDRLIIRETLKVRYSRRYIDYMFTCGRKRTALFKQTVRAYWKSKQELAEEMNELMNEFNNKEEELNNHLLHNTK